MSTSDVAVVVTFNWLKEFQSVLQNCRGENEDSARSPRITNTKSKTLFRMRFSGIVLPTGISTGGMKTKIDSCNLLLFRERFHLKIKVTKKQAAALMKPYQIFYRQSWPVWCLTLLTTPELGLKGDLTLSLVHDELVS